MAPLRRQRVSVLSVTILVVLCVNLSSIFRESAFVGSNARASGPTTSSITTRRAESLVGADIPKHKLGLETSATELMKAAYKGDTPQMKRILEEGKEDINAQDEFGWTALRYAIRNQKKDAAKMLAVDFKADVNLASKSGCTPLMSAARNNMEEMVKGLVNCGADLTAVDTEGLTAFDYARIDAIKAMVDPAPAQDNEETKEAADPAEKPEWATVRKVNARWEAAVEANLISADIPKHKLGLGSSATDLMKAAWEGDTVKLYSLLTGTRGEQIAININAQDEFGWTALRYAVRNSQADAARMLAVTFKADINLASKSGRTPLMSAAGNNLEEMVKGLVNLGADLKAVDNEGLTAFDHARNDAIKAMVDPGSTTAAEVAKEEPAESWQETKASVKA